MQIIVHSGDGETVVGNVQSDSMAQLRVEIARDGGLLTLRSAETGVESLVNISGAFLIEQRG